MEEVFRERMKKPIVEENLVKVFDQYLKGKKNQKERKRKVMVSASNWEKCIGLIVLVP